jgi:hypothetical protein
MKLIKMAALCWAICIGTPLHTEGESTTAPGLRPLCEEAVLLLRINCYRSKSAKNLKSQERGTQIFTTPGVVSMMENHLNDITDLTRESKAILKVCPFCSHIPALKAMPRPWIECRGCGVSLAPVEPVDEAELVGRWNRRHGTHSAAGGRATKGLSTKRKRRASRRNLRRARRVKQFLRILPLVEQAQRENEKVLSRLQPLLAAALKESYAAIRRLEPLCRQDPALSQLYDMAIEMFLTNAEFQSSAASAQSPTLL